MEGYLWKKGDRGVLAGYKRRWFSISGSEMQYFEDASERKLLGTVDLPRLVRVSRGNPASHRKRAISAFAANVLELEVPGRTYILIPEREEDLHSWVSAMAVHVDRSSFRGDLKKMADDGVRDPDDAPEPSPARRAAGRSAEAAIEHEDMGVAKASVDRSRASTEDDFGPALIGSGRSGGGGGGGGFFGRMASPAPSAADQARMRELEDGYAKTQHEVVKLRQELATIRSSAAASSQARASSPHKGRKELGASLLGRRGSRDYAADDERRGGGRDDDDLEEDDDEEEEVLPGCACCGGRCTCKVLFLVLVNIVVIITGLAIASAGGFALSQQKVLKLILSSLASEILLAVGIGFVLIGVLGSFAATRFTKRSGRCLLLPYILFMAVLTVVELAGAVFLIIDVDNIKVPAAGATAANVAQQNLETFLTDTYLTCCNTTSGGAPPSGLSCQWLPPTVTSGCPNVLKRAFEERVTDLLHSELAPIGGAAAGLVVLHAAAAWFALTLLCPCCSCGCLTCCCRRKKQDADDGDEDRADQRRGGVGRSRASSRAGSKGRGQRPSRKGSMYADFDD